MKKIVLPLLVIAALAAVAAFFIHRAAPTRPRAVELVPETAMVFAHVPDVRGTVERFGTTEMSKLGQEPEVQAFLNRPLAKAPQSAELQAHLMRLAQVDARELFIAVNSFDGPTPQLLGGFAFNGSRKAVRDLLEPARVQLQKARPASKIDLVTYGAAEIELLTDKEFTVAQAIHKDWCLISTDLTLLHRTLDRLDGKKVDGGSLAEAAIFREATAPLPAGREGLFYARLSDLTKRLADLMAATGQPLSTDVEQLKRFRAITASTTIHAGKFLDTIFVLAPGSTPEPQLTRNALALTSPATLVYYSAALPAQFAIPEATRVALATIAPPFAAADKAITEHGLEWKDLGAAFGPELGLLVEWPPQSLQPVMVVALDVRDHAKARKFVETLTAASGEMPAWSHQEENGISVYRSSQPPQPVAIAAPSLAFSDRFLLISASRDAAMMAMRRAEEQQSGLSSTTDFVAAQQALVAPTTAYGYFNLQALFDRAYGTFRPFLAMSLAFMPNAAEYVDASKLPPTETVSRHLGQITYSQAQTADGILAQSSGTFTLNQALLGIVAGSVGAAFPALNNARAGQPLDLSKLFGIPGFPPQTPATAPRTDPAAPNESLQKDPPLPPIEKESAGESGQSAPTPSVPAPPTPQPADNPAPRDP